MVVKSNLFKGDRVRLSRSHINSLEMRAKASKTGMLSKLRERLGTVDNDTMAPRARYINVLWDGNQYSGHHDIYTDMDLELVEEGYEMWKEAKRPGDIVRETLLKRGDQVGMVIIQRYTNKVRVASFLPGVMKRILGDSPKLDAELQEWHGNPYSADDAFDRYVKLAYNDLWSVDYVAERSLA